MSASSPRHGSGSRAAARLVLAIMLSAFVAGCVPWELRQVLDGPRGKALSISPSTTLVPGGGTLTFAADGGVPPYTFSMALGLGSVDPVTGFFTASASPGPSVVRVTDRTGKSQDATITVQSSGPLAISPAAVSVVAGGSLTFLPIGGSGTYAFTMQSSGSGSPSVTSPGGIYTAGSTPGTDKVRLTDTVTSAFVDATVTVTAVASTVNYTVSSVAALPASGTVSSTVPAGTFTLQNIGTGDGQQTVTWELYLSADTTLGGGDWLVGSGTASALGATLSQSVSIGGTLPAVSPGPWNLLVHVSAADDTSPANNTSGARPITLSAQNIDYVVPAPGPTGVAGPLAGQSVTGSFTIDNAGTADGAAGIEWAVYASVDTTLDGADYLVASGSHAAIAAATAPPTINFSGYWPSSPGTWYLLATVSASDDVSALNNTTASGSTFPTTGSAPPNIDYRVVSLSSSGTVAGDPLSGTFSIQNLLADTGVQPVSWTAYLSPDATLDLPGDTVLDSGSATAVAGSTTSGPLTFHGTWPSTPGSWYLIIAVSSSEDTDPANNATASATPVATTAPNIDYTVSSVGGVVGTTAGAAFTGSLTIQNVGTHGGTQFVPWSVYLSSDSTLSLGTDQLVATGSLPSPGLAAGAPSTQPFGGTWPASVSTNNYYLIAVVGAGDDAASANNTVPSVSFVTVNPPNVNYTVTVVNAIVGTTAGGPFTAQFSAQNVGTAGGTTGVNWTAYVSSDAILDISDTAFQTGSFGFLGPGATNGPFVLAGTWPAGAANRYIIVKLSASDDVASGNDSTASVAVPVTTPVYTITSVPIPGGFTAGQAVNGTFTIQNTSTANGSAIINWTAYASLNNSIWDGGDAVIANGATGALNSGASASPPYGGVWPNVAGNYYVIIRAQAADAAATATGATAGLIGVIGPNVDYTVPNVTVNAVPRITGQPVSGTFTYRNSGGNPGTPSQTLSWDVYASTNTTIDGSDTLIASNVLLPALGNGVTSGAIPWSGNWPLSYGDYYILVRVTGAEDVNTTNNVGASALQTNVGVYSDAAGEPNNDYTLLSNPMPLGITLQPGMAVKITGSMNTGDRDDIFQYNTGTANRVVVTVAWSIPNQPSVRIWYMTGPNVFASGVSGLNGSMSLDWVPDASGVNRWIDLDDYWTGSNYLPPPNPSALTYTAWIVAQ